MGLIINPASDIIRMSSLNKGLVGYWPLDKESLQSATIFADKTPNENKGTSANAPVFVTDRMGQADRAMRFNGGSDTVRIPDSESLSSTTAMSAMIWVKGAGQENKAIIDKFDYNANKISYKISSMVTSPYQKMRVIVSDDGTLSDGHRKTYDSSINILDGLWHLIGFTFNAGTLKIYVDRVEDISVTKTADDAITTIFTSDQDVMIGSQLSNNVPTAFFTGDLSEHRMFNRALSQQEITTLYDAYRPKIMLSQPIYGIAWDQVANTYTRTGAIKDEALHSSPGNAKLPIHAKMRRCVVSDAGVVQYYLDPTDSTKKENGDASDLTGGDGQVMVRIPKFYCKHGFAGTTHAWDICENHRPYYEVHPAFIKDGVEVDYRYIGAYEGSMWDATTSAMVPSANIVTDMYASGDKLCSYSGEYPKTNEMRSEFRAMGSERGAGWRQLDFDLNSAVQLLYLIEYADFDSQTEIGMGRTELSGGSWVADSYIGQCGKSNSDGDGTNSVAGNTNNAYMTYRGIENWYGNVWKWNDGININNHVPYVTNNASAWADDTATGYTDLGVTLAAANNYQITLCDTDRGFFPASVGASTTYVSDYYWQSTGWRVVLLGGSANYGAHAGAFYLYAATSDGAVSIGGRLAY